MLKYFLCLLLTGIFLPDSFGQSNLNVKFLGMNLHPQGDPNAELMPLNLDDKGYWVLTLGGTIGYEQFIKSDKFSIKVMQGAYSDCAARFSGFTHVGVRWLIFRKGKHSLNGGLGPTFVYRRNWYDLEGYIDSGYFNGKPNQKWQHKFIPYAGEFEYNVALNDRYDLSTALVPGYPDIISLSVGVRYWFNKQKKSSSKQTDSPAVNL